MKWKLLNPAEEESLETAAWYDLKRFGLGDEFLDELQRSIFANCECS